MTVGNYIVSLLPGIRYKFKRAGMLISPEEYFTKAFKTGLIMSLSLGFILGMIVLKEGGNIILPIVVTLVLFFFQMFSKVQQVNSKILKKQKEIDRDVLFAGRFLLVKLNSGKPLVIAIEDAAKSYGVGKKVFQDIIRDLDMGTPLEMALDNAARFSASDKFKRIVMQISTAIKVGVNVSRGLEKVLEDINLEQMLEIQKYGKKLNSMSMFYMIMGIVLPSLGVTMFVVMASFTGIEVSQSIFMIVLIAIVVVQLFFIVLFKSIRPNLDI
jgi:flagellar protein FlaJ